MRALNPQTSITRERHPHFFRALRANALFSTASAAIFILLADPLSGQIGLAHAWFLIAVGLGLALFAGRLWQLSRSGSLPRVEAWSICLADMSWVMGTALLLLWMPETLNRVGWSAAGVIAAVVLLLAVRQAQGIRAPLSSTAGS